MKALALHEFSQGGECLWAFERGGYRFFGIVRGQKTPSAGRYCHLEIDLPSRVEVRDCHRSEGFIESCGDVTLVQGIVENVEPDGLLILRIYEDCILMVEVGQFNAETGKCYLLKMPARKVDVWLF